MTNHSESEQVLDYAYGELASDDVARFEAHLKSCPACSDELASIRGVRRTMAKLTPEPAPLEGVESLQSYAENAARNRTAPRPAPWRRWVMALSAGAAVVVVGGIAREVTKDSVPVVDRVLSYSQRKEESPQAMVAPPAVEAPKAQEPEVAGKQELEEEAKTQFAQPPPGRVAPASPASPAKRVASAKKADSSPTRDVSLRKKTSTSNAREESAPGDGFGAYEASSALPPPPAPTAAPVPSRRPMEYESPAAAEPSVAALERAPAKAKSQRADVAEPSSAQRPSAAGAMSAPSAPKGMATSYDDRAADEDLLSGRVVQLKAVLARGPQGASLEQTLMDLCRFQTRLERYSEARLYCERLLREFPQSRSVAEAKRILQTLPR